MSLRMFLEETSIWIGEWLKQKIRRRQWQPTPVPLPGKSHGRRSLVGCSPWGCYELGTTERLHFTFHFHALEKEMATHSSVLVPRDVGAWWVAISGVAQSRTRLKRLSSSNNKEKDHPQNGLITFNLLRAWTEQKDKGKLDLLCPFLLEPRCPPPPALSAPSSQAFRPGLKFTPLALWLSRLLIVWLTPVGLQHVVDRLQGLLNLQNSVNHIL